MILWLQLEENITSNINYCKKVQLLKENNEFLICKI